VNKSGQYILSLNQKGDRRFSEELTKKFGHPYGKFIIGKEEKDG
jgi:hypothetical protein